ncbi:hypothetical protein [Mesorhizobium sp. B263B2A]|nr:hypothetical protein [Mesorhizobium sp. B263B2A]
MNSIPRESRKIRIAAAIIADVRLDLAAGLYMKALVLRLSGK